jgi:hypothetical protein
LTLSWKPAPVSLYSKYFTQKKFQEMLHHAARVGIQPRPVLCIEAKQEAVELVASASEVAVHISGEMIGRTRSPIANHRQFS